MKKRILLATNYSPNDTTAFLRSWGPFSQMRDLVEIVTPPPIDGWQTDLRYWMGIDVCFLHRPYGPYAAQVMDQARYHGIPLWVDHDDALDAIPEKNPHRQIHERMEKICPSIQRSYVEADILTCSGEMMYEKIKRETGRQDITLITTAMDDRLIRFKRDFSGNEKVSWRGSDSHRSDLVLFRDQLSNLMQDHPEKSWLFFGIDPKSIGLSGAYYQETNLFKYYDNITNHNCSLHFVVLEDNYFNRVKSNLAWIDATLAGSCVVAPEYPEYVRPGIINYKGSDPKDFEFIFDLTLRRVDYDYYLFLKTYHDQSWEYIQDCLLLSNINEKRRNILRNL